jgi:hypothetical protein
MMNPIRFGIVGVCSMTLACLTSQEKVSNPMNYCGCSALIPISFLILTFIYIALDILLKPDILDDHI